MSEPRGSGTDRTPRFFRRFAGVRTQRQNAGDRAADETLAIGAMLYSKLVELALRGRQRWNGAGKWAPRLLIKIDPELAIRFDSAFRALFTMGDAGPVIMLAEAELAPHGGPLFDGDRRDAPGSWRVA